MSGLMRLLTRDIQARAVVGSLAAPVRTASGAVTQTLLILIDVQWWTGESVGIRTLGGPRRKT